jgi:hypothetical protein
MMQQGDYNRAEVLDNRTRAFRAVMMARAVEAQYITRWEPHPELPNTWIKKRIARKDGKPMKR